MKAAAAKRSSGLMPRCGRGGGARGLCGTADAPNAETEGSEGRVAAAAGAVFGRRGGGGDSRRAIRSLIGCGGGRSLGLVGAAARPKAEVTGSAAGTAGFTAAGFTAEARGADLGRPASAAEPETWHACAA